VQDGSYQLTVPGLAPGQTHVLSLPVNAPAGTESVSVLSSLTVRNGVDSKPSNDSLSGQIILIAPETLVGTAQNGP
jgi:hypothetical protein